MSSPEHKLCPFCILYFPVLFHFKTEHPRQFATELDRIPSFLKSFKTPDGTSDKSQNPSYGQTGPW